ncbi:general stress protein [Nocardioides aquiterrae]|uniref:General stress protein 17M-like domain-containing protein n=1 Tax=Nocardioides aquiterrae TaxID=203799 RepID=A0ABP4F2A2_9ACTN
MSQSNSTPPGLRHHEPVRRVIASYDSYAEAEAAVDHLADREFPVERLAIVGQDVKLVEQVTGRLTYTTAAMHGAAAGALPGALIGWVFGLFDWVDPLTSSLLLAFYGLIFGAVLGGLLNIVVYAMQQGRRDFTTVTVMQPSRYDILADADVADRALRELQARGGVRGEAPDQGPPAR